MSTTVPTVAVVNLPTMLGALTDAGFALLVDSVDAKIVAPACSKEPAGREVVVLIAGLDTQLSMWVDFQLRSCQRKVVVLVSDQLPSPAGVPDQARVVNLPASVDQIMGAFGAPPVGGTAGGRMVWEDGAVEPMAVEQFDGPVDPFLDVADAFPIFVEPELVREPVPVEFVQVVPVPEIPAFPQPQGLAQSMPTPIAVPRPAALPRAFTPVLALEPIRLAPVPQMAPVVVEQVPVPPLYSPSFSPVSPVAYVAPVAPSFPQGPPPPAPAPQLFPVQTPRRAFAPPDDYLGAPEPAGLGQAARPGSSSRLCPIIIVVSAKGGVGKTTISTSLAQHAAENGLRKSVLVDMNRGQGDVRKYLRVSDLNGLVPTVFDAAVAPSPTGFGTGNPQGAIIRPLIVNQHRVGLKEISFGCAFAPRDGQADPTVVTADFYAEVLRAARMTADLVVVDTQIVESYDTSGLFDRVVVPLLASDPAAWCLAVTGPAMPGVHSMLHRWSVWAARDVPKDRMMFAFNRWVDGSTLNRDAVAKSVEQWASFLGAVPDDLEIFASLSNGKIPNNVPSMGVILDQVLLRVTGSEAFHTDRYLKAKPGFLSRLVGARR